MARKKKTTEEIKEAAKETVDEKVSSDATKEEEDDGAKDEENEDTLQEVWDVVHTLNCSESELICRMDKCKRAAVVVWATDANPDDKWPLCEPCQEKEFGGWPEGTQPPVSTGSDKKSETEGADDATEEEQWELKMILSGKAVADEAPIKCYTESCTLPAACAWVSHAEPTKKWYTCLDCQEADFGGWPSTEELPIKFMTKEHAQILAEKCSRNPNIKVPTFETASPSKTEDNPGIDSNAFTPRPTNSGDIATQGGLPKVTPFAADSAKQAKKPTKPSKAALEIHQKWQKEAEAMGGKGARIVMEKGDAKKLIFDVLHEAFRPMNITQIHKELKATVPKPTLSVCLTEMASLSNDDLFAESDDEDSPKETKKTSTDPYHGSLRFKASKGNPGIYYVDHTKLSNNGNGLDPGAKNQLHADVQKVRTEEASLTDILQKIKTQTTELLSQPTNEDAAALLETQELELAELKEKVEAGRKLKVNEKHKKNLKRRIDEMAAHWRKRRRMCMDFLVAMEENTEGTISVKKCLNGDGQIEIDSDEAVAKAAMSFYQMKQKREMNGVGTKKRVLSKKLHVASSSGAKENAVMATESFVAVKLDALGRPERFYAEDGPTE